MSREKLSACISCDEMILIARWSLFWIFILSSVLIVISSDKDGYRLNGGFSFVGNNRRNL